MGKPSQIIHQDASAVSHLSGFHRSFEAPELDAFGKDHVHNSPDSERLRALENRLAVMCDDHERLRKAYVSHINHGHNGPVV